MNRPHTDFDAAAGANDARVVRLVRWGDPLAMHDGYEVITF